MLFEPPVFFMYHSLTASGDRHPATSFHRNKYTISREVFARHVDIASGKNVVLTFDDGHRSIYEIALPLIQDRVPSIAFVSTGLLGDDDWIGEAEVRGLAKAGVTIAAHSVHHPNLAGLEPATLERELVDSRRRLQDITGTPIKEMSLPGGHFNAGVMRAVRDAGYERVYCSEPGRGTTRWGGIRRQWILNNQTDAEFEKMCGGWVPPALRLRYALGKPVKRVRAAAQRLRQPS